VHTLNSILKTTLDIYKILLYVVDVRKHTHSHTNTEYRHIHIHIYVYVLYIHVYTLYIDTYTDAGIDGHSHRNFMFFFRRHLKVGTTVPKRCNRTARSGTAVSVVVSNREVCIVLTGSQSLVAALSQV
jgi:hypothetical protein